MKKSKQDHLLNDIIDSLSNTQKIPFDETTPYYTHRMRSADALRVILYRLYLNILYYKECILNNDDEESLHQFRVNIRKSRAFIKEFGFLFQKRTDKHLNKQLSKIAGYTNKKRDLDVIKERLFEIKSENKYLEETLELQIREEQQKIKALLRSETFELFFEFYKKILEKGDHLFLDPKDDKKIAKMAKKVILKLYQKILDQIDDLEKNFSVKKLHKLRIAFKKLRYLLEEFKHLFDEHKLSKMIGKGKKMQTLLGDFNDTVNQKVLLHEYLQKYQDRIEDVDEFEKLFMTKTIQKEEELIAKARKDLRKFKQKDLKL